MSTDTADRDIPGSEHFRGYKTVRKVGEGVSSVVFEAIREGDDYAQRVAIKLLLEPGELRLGVAETKILARLEHPNIARLLDAGSTQQGARFLVTEFVDGEPCTAYAQRKALDEKARLRLFLDICEAVQFANRALIIHCDIKPANVLVRSDGTVKLLDFGISRLLSESAQDGNTRARFYSPHYASPEQILGKPLSVATDVYSLGALLHELLTGQPPLADGGDHKSTLTGDIGVVVGKSLRTEVPARYATVADLAADIKRYLAGKPIEARPISPWERLWKFAARHKAGTAFCLLGLIALGASTLYAVRQRSIAEERFAQIRALANSMLFEMHDELARVPGSLAARHLLTERGVQYLDALATSAGRDASLQLEAARGVMRLADIEGVGNEPNLGRTAQAQARLEKTESTVKATRATNPSNYEAVRVHALMQEALATAYTLQADARSIPMARDYLQSTESMMRLQPSNEKAKEEFAHAKHVVAHAYTQSKSESAKGVDAWKDTVATWTELAKAQPNSVTRKRELARSYQFYAGSLSRDARREEAREAILVAYKMHKELAVKDPEEEEHMLAADVGLLANLNAQLKRYDEAIPLFEEQLHLREKALAKNPSNVNAQMGVAGTMDRIGYAMVRMGKAAEGLPWLERSLDRQRQIYKLTPTNVLVGREMLFVLSDIAEANDLLKRRDKTCAYAREGKQVMGGAISKGRETAVDAAKKKILNGFLKSCGA